MTSTNIVDTTQQNGHAHEKSPEEIQLEIARTRSAITEDLLAISERLSPQHLREGAREMMRDAREEAKEMLKGAKDAALDSLIGVKDRAVESVSEKVHLLGDQARRASDMTVSFVSANAVAVSLVGFGVGCLLVALQRRKSLPLRLQREAYRPRHYVLAGTPQTQRAAPPSQVRSMATLASQSADYARDEVRSAGSRAPRGVEQGRYASEGFRRAPGRTRALPVDNRVAVLAVTVAAGLGFGLLWPTGGGRPRSRAY